MKAKLFSSDGKEPKTIELPKIFETPVREDIVQKFFEANKLTQPYSPKFGAGLRQSASGTISHKRHDWKGHYGQGRSRMPRKTMSRRGTQFYWVGANVPGARGGRKAHPPKGIGKEKKLNKKEISLAMNSAFAATISPKFIEKRYFSLDKIENAAFAIESLPEKTKSLLSVLKHILSPKLFQLAFKKKTVRPGKGKSRGRKYKLNAGILIVTSEKENKKFKGLDVKSTKEIAISDLYPLGRLTLYTKLALEELDNEVTKNKIKGEKK